MKTLNFSELFLILAPGLHCQNNENEKINKSGKTENISSPENTEREDGGLQAPEKIV